MKNNKKLLSILSLTLAITLILSGCENKPEPATEREPLTHVYVSNLNDSASINLLESLFKKASISNERQSVFWNHVLPINEALGKDVIEKDFEKLGVTETKYDPYALADKLAEEYPDFVGYNCRITAFSLFKDFIKTNGNPINTEPDILLFDLDSLDFDSSALISDEELNDFKEIYTEIPTDKTLDETVHIKRVQDTWKERGVEFKQGTNASLISMFFYYSIDENNPKLFVGHTGILFPSDDGSLYFLEKLSFQEPYQLVKFKNKAELSDYLVARFGQYSPETEAKPFIFENDKLLKI